ncbi:MAG: fimbrillin family protein [Candidatus Cryptobacteroides sp.]
MKKTNILYFAALAAFVTVSCSKELVDKNEAVQQPNLVPMTFTVAESVEEETPDSRTTLVIADDKKTINWVANDKVGVFGVADVPTSETSVNTNNQIFTAKSSGATTTLSGYVVDGDNRFYALYPYQKGVSLTFVGTTGSDGTTSYTAYLNNVTIPVQQKAVAGSFDPDAYLFASLSTDQTNFKFYTPCSLVGFTLNDSNVSNIKSIRLYGNNSNSDVLAAEKGQIKVYGAASTHLVTEGQSNYVELVLDGSDKFQNSVQYYFVVRRVSLASGISLYVEYEDGTVKKRTSSNKFDVSADNCIKSLGTLKLDGDAFTKLTYSEAYELGYDLVIGDKVYNKSTTPSYNTLDATSETVNLNTAATSGLYFLKGEKFTLAANWTISDDFVLIGDTDGVKIGNNGKYIVHASRSFSLKNLSLSVGDDLNYFILNNASTDASDLVLDGCNININASSKGSPFFYSSNGYAAQSITLKNCNFALKGTANNIFNFANAKSTQLANINISGCSFSSETTTRVLTIPAWSNSEWKSSLTFQNNNFIDFIPDTAVLQCNGKMEVITATGNTGTVKLSKNSYLVYFSKDAQPTHIDAEIDNISVSQSSESASYTFTKYPAYN